MSFGLSFSDLERGIKIAIELWEAFFVKVNRAELRYKEFGDEIKSLEKCLRKLANVFETAIREREERIFLPDYKALDSLVDRERRELVGDFENTLVLCRDLLSKNAQFLTKSAGVGGNAKWHFKTQNTVDLLRSRLSSHTAKILLVLQPLQCQLLQEISGNVWEIRHDVRALREEVRLLKTTGTETLPQDRHPTQDHHVLPPVPPELDSLLVEAVEIRKPGTYSTISAFPLKEGFDALICHFRESTLKFSGDDISGSSSPTVEQLLNLIKARWILEKLKESSCLHEAGPNSLWARSLSILEIKILEQFRRPAIGYDVCIRESSNISQLGRESFVIWLAEEPLQAPRNITDEDSGEEKVLEVPLQEPDGVSKKTLMLFRQAANEFRLVRAAVPEAEGFAPQGDEKIINTHAFRLSPHYILPGLSPSMSVHVSGNHVHRGDFYDLKSLEDVFKVQHALTSYKVVHHSIDVDWTTCHSGFFRTRQETGIGNLQIWMSTPMQGMISENYDSSGVRAIVSTRSLPDSRSSVITSMTAEDIARGFGGGLALIRSGANEGGGQVIAGSRPRDPVLVIFTRWRGNLCFLHLQIDDSIKMRREPCYQCTDSRHICCELVIRKSKNKRFLMRKHTAEADKSGNDILPTWNLCVFGLPRHPEFQKLEKLNDITWLNLHFPSTDSREAFETAFQTALEVREIEQGVFRNLSAAVEWSSQRQGSIIGDKRSSLALTPKSTLVRG